MPSVLVLLGENAANLPEDLLVAAPKLDCPADSAVEKLPVS